MITIIDFSFLLVLLINSFLLIKVFFKLKKKQEFKHIQDYVLPSMIHRRIKIHSKFSDKEKKEIYESLETWKKITCGLFDYSIIEDNAVEIDLSDGYNTIVFLRCSSRESLLKVLDHRENNKIYGYAYQNHPNVILIVPDRIKSLLDFRKILIHEIGHMLNISHIRDQKSIMHKYYNGSNRITKNDLIAFLSVCQWDYECVKFDKDPFWIK
jgi:hypothetical protein